MRAEWHGAGRWLCSVCDRLIHTQENHIIVETTEHPYGLHAHIICYRRAQRRFREYLKRRRK